MIRWTDSPRHAVAPNSGQSPLHPVDRWCIVILTMVLPLIAFLFVSQQGDPSHPVRTPIVTATDGLPSTDYTNGWVPVPSDIADALAEGDDSPPESAATRHWEACWMHVADTTTITCPDGFTITS